MGVVTSINYDLLENKKKDLSFLRDNLLTRNEMLMVNPSADYPFEERYWQNFFNLGRKTSSYLLRKSGKTIGHAVLQQRLDNNTIWLCWVLIQHNHRRSGAGKVLLSLVEQKLIEHFASNEYFLNVRKDNLRAISFYKKMGFEEISQKNNSFQMKKCCSSASSQ